jgi:maltose-binding protein MalE
MFKAGGRPPAHAEACTIAMKDDPFIKVVVDSVNDGIAMPNVRAMSVVWNYAAGMIDKYKTGEQTVENAVKTAVQTIKDDLKGNPSRFE